MDLQKILSQAAEILKRRKATHILLPDDETLIQQEAEGPGKHIHDDNNPLGLHRHHQGDTLDGAHIHTPQNPGGVHVHGELAGQPMTRNDGHHLHEDGGLGPHRHVEEDSGRNIPVHNSNDSV